MVSALRVLDPPPRAGAALSPRRKPAWLRWELHFSDHVSERMLERGLTENDLRHILAHARRYRRSPRPGVYLVNGRVHGQKWAIGLCPDADQRIVTVVTAYPLPRTGR